MSYKTIIGIDNGLDGGCCALDAITSEIISILPMPTIVYGGKREIDIEKILTWVRLWERPLVAIEEPLHFSRTLQSMRSMSISFGSLKGMCIAAGLPLTRVQVLDWQRTILGKNIPKGLTKVYAFNKARLIWPQQEWCVGRSKKPHDGIIDAALIGKYANENTIQEPIRKRNNIRKARKK